jgi:hypothetical protein
MPDWADQAGADVLTAVPADAVARPQLDAVGAIVGVRNSLQ